MLIALMIPFTTAVTVTTIDATVAPKIVLAKEKESKNDDDSGKNKDSDKDSSDSSSSSSADSSSSSNSDGTKNVLDQPASDLATAAAKDMTEDQSNKKSDDKPKDASDKESEDVKVLDILGNDGSNGYSVGNAWSFMAAENDAIWQGEGKSNAKYAVDSKVAKSSRGSKNGRFKTSPQNNAYLSMVNAVHFAYVMNQLGLDKSFSTGFNGQKHSLPETLAAFGMQVAYSGTKLVNQLFSFVFKFLHDFNPFNAFLHPSDYGDGHFGPVANLLNELYDAGQSVGKTVMVFLFLAGVTLAVMGMQIGQSSIVSPGKGIVAAGVDLLKRGFVIIAFPMLLALSYTSLLNLCNSLFENAGYTPGNYAIYSTMTPFQAMVTHGRFNFDQTMSQGLLPNSVGAIADDNDNNVTGRYLTHKQVINLNAELGMDGAKELQSTINNPNDTSRVEQQLTRSVSDGGDATSMLKDFVSNKTYSAADFASQILPAIPSDSNTSGQSNSDSSNNSSTSKADKAEAAFKNLKSRKYAANGCLKADDSSFRIVGGVQGSGTVSSAEQLANGAGGLSTLGTYNYLQSVTRGTSVNESSSSDHNNDVSNPQHFSVNFVGTGMNMYGNIFFAFSLMFSMIVIAGGTAWFMIKAFLDSVPGSITGIIQGAFGSLAGGAKAVGALLGFFISLGVTGLTYQLSFRLIVAVLTSIESYGPFQGGASTASINLFGLKGATPAVYANHVALSASTFGFLSMFEGALILYITFATFKYSARFKNELAAVVNTTMTRVMQSFGAITGKGGGDFRSSGMMNQVNNSNSTGFSNLANASKLAMNAGGKGLNFLSGGKSKAGKMLSGAAKAGGMGLIAGAAMQGLSAVDEAIEDDKKGDKKHGPHKSAEQARNQQMQADLASRQGQAHDSDKKKDNQDNPLDKMNTNPTGTGIKQAKQAKDASKAQGQGVNPMDLAYSDQSQAQDALQQDGYTSNDQNKAHDKKNENDPQKQLDQVLAQAYGTNGSISDPMQNQQLQDQNGQQKAQGRRRNSQAQPSQQQRLQQQAANTPGAKIAKFNAQAAQAFQNAMGFDNQAQAGNNSQIKHLSNNSNAKNFASSQQADVMNNVASMPQDVTDGVNASQVQGQPQIQFDANGNPMSINTNTSDNGMTYAGTTVNGMSQNAPQMQGQPQIQFDANGNPMPISTSASDNGMAYAGTAVDGMPQDDPGLSQQQSQNLANLANNTFGTNVSADQVQQMAPQAAGVIDSMSHGVEQILDAGANEGTGGTQTITALGNGQAAVSNGSGVEAINGTQSYGLGRGVMPGAVPAGFVANPEYSSSGAGVLHGGLNQALGNVQNANNAVVQAQNAASVNPGNSVVQQRATQAVRVQRQAQVQAMQAFNSTPARQTVGSLINSNAPANLSTGQVNQAVQQVYGKQQAFKEAVSSYGRNSPETQTAASEYRQALNTARQVHIKSTILDKPAYLQKAYQNVRKQQMSIMDGSFKL